MKNVISICDFYRDKTYQCNDPTAARNETKPASDEIQNDEEAPSGEGVQPGNTESVPLINLTILQLETGIAVINFRCNVTRSAKRAASDSQESTNIHQRTWSYDDGKYLAPRKVTCRSTSEQWPAH